MADCCPNSSIIRVYTPDGEVAFASAIQITFPGKFKTFTDLPNGGYKTIVKGQAGRITGSVLFGCDFNPDLLQSYCGPIRVELEDFGYAMDIPKAQSGGQLKVNNDQGEVSGLEFAFDSFTKVSL